MHSFDVIEILVRVSRKAALVILAMLLIGMIWWRAETTNLVLGQAFGAAVDATNPAAKGFGIQCSVQQEGLWDAPSIDCESIPTTTTSTTTTVVNSTAA